LFETEPETNGDYHENLRETVKDLFKAATGDAKNEGRDIIKSYGKFADVDDDGLRKLYDLLNA
jgi:hypothetical protein